MRDLAHDLGLIVRSLRRAPIFSVVVIVSLGASIAAATLAYGVYYAVNLRPLAAESPERLVSVFAAQSDECGARCLDVFSMATFERLAAQSRTVIAAAAFEGDERRLGDSAAREEVRVTAVSGSFFPLVGTHAIVGRSVRPTDDSVGSIPTAVLSFSFWTSRFASRRDIVGQSILLDGVPHLVLGVMPAGFTLPAGTAAWTAGTPDSVARPGRPRMVEGIARLRDGATIARANAEWRLLAQRRAMESRGAGRAAMASARVLPLASVRHGVDTTLALALLAVATHFLIMCCNVQGALALRVLRRRRELAIRTALGGSHRDLLRLAAIEISILSIASCLLGAALVWWGLGAAQVLLGARFPFLFTVSVDPLVGLVGLGLALMVSLSLMAGYAWAAGSLELRPLLADCLTTGARRGGRLRSRLVVLQVALALFLGAVAAGLARSFRMASTTDLAVRADDVLAVPLDLSGTQFDAPEQARALVDDIERTLGAGTRSESVTLWRSTAPAQWGDTTFVEGSNLVLDSHACRSRSCPAPWSSQDVTPSFFATLGIRALRGRVFSAYDGPGDPPVVVVNEIAASRWWPGQDPIGRRIRLGGNRSTARWLTVVGVVHSPFPLDHMGVRLSLQDGGGYPLIFRPLVQTTMGSRAELPSWMWFRNLWIGYASPGEDGQGTQQSLRAAIATLAPGVHIGPIESLRAAMLAQTGWPTVEANARLASLFGIAGVLIALFGVCGVTAEVVRSRARELATRMALGASPRSIVLHVVSRTAILAGAGVGLGTLVCIAASGFMSRTFSGYDGFVRGEHFVSGMRGAPMLDPTILAWVGLMLFGVCVLASYLPARAAARIDPAAPLRDE